MERLLAGQTIAVVSDAGTPGISDPGFLVAREAIKAGIEVITLPGATAFVPALVSSGLPCDRFCFEGFLPQKKGRQTRIAALAEETRTMIIYEAPHHLLKTLKELYEVLGDRSITLCKELTKLYEKIRKTTISELIAEYEVTEPKGEHVLVIAGKTFKEKKDASIQSYLEMSIEDHMEMYLSKAI